MPLIRVTKADILKTQNLTPGWYKCQVVKVHPPSKADNGQSVNYVMDCVILPGQEKEGKEVAARFNSQLMGKIAPFFYACTGKMIDDTMDIDTEEVMGKKFDGKIIQTNYQGVLYDNFESFLPFNSSSDVPF